jgi:glutamyl-tRNA synthetase
MTLVRTRFSPSPTGIMHIGNVRTALFSALFAKHKQGVFILRIEDTDAARSESRFIEMLKDDLHWMNIDWQEGPDKNGSYGPYWQSLRQDIYAGYYQQLEQLALIYPCFCSEQELTLARKLQLSRGLAPRYHGACLKLSADEIQKRKASGLKPAWRFKVPVDTEIKYDDFVKGPQLFRSDDIGDFIIRRADGTAPFLFCNAIDDALMKVTHVMRGEDHVGNTPRQLLLLKALNLPMPCYGHLSLIVGSDGAPLAKRHGSASVRDLREQGFLSSAVLNYLARLGHSLESNELMTFEQLALQFRIERLSRSPARFDHSQLLFWQKQAVQALDNESLWRWLGENIRQEVAVQNQTLFIDTIKSNITFPQDAMEWTKIFFSSQLSFDDESKGILQNAGEQFFVVAEQAVDKYGTDFTAVLADMKANLNINGKRLFMPLRIALTGKMHGPELLPIAKLLGVKKIQSRFRHVLELIS